MRYTLPAISLMLSCARLDESGDLNTGMGLFAQSKCEDSDDHDDEECEDSGGCPEDTGEHGPCKQVICHEPTPSKSETLPITIEVACAAVEAHLAHGDSLGPCEPTDTGDSGVADDTGEVDTADTDESDTDTDTDTDADADTDTDADTDSDTDSDSDTDTDTDTDTDADSDSDVDASEPGETEPTVWAEGGKGCSTSRTNFSLAGLAGLIAVFNRRRTILERK